MKAKTKVFEVTALKTKNKVAIAPEMLEKAKRTISVRRFAGLTREEMKSRHNIPTETLRRWESPGSIKKQGLTQKGAQRLVNALKLEGVSCSVEWLLNGTGVGPHFLRISETEMTNKFKKKHTLWGSQIVIQNEINFFEQNNPDSVVVMITDDGLEPFFSQGDYVGGIKIYSKEIVNALNYYCIIETFNKEILVRKLSPGNIPDTFSLYCTNLQTTSSESTFNDVQLKWAAPIAWHRKNNF